MSTNYHDVGEFSEGLALVSKKFVDDFGLDDFIYGFIDESGTEVIPCIYYRAKSFRNGHALVRLEGKVFLIDKQGKEVIPTNKYIHISPFTEDLALVVREKAYVNYYKAKGFVDINGNEVIPCKYADLQPFKEGLAAACDFNNRKWGFINKVDEVIVPFKFDNVFRFENGFAIVSKEVVKQTNRFTKKKRYGVIDKKGNVVVPVKFSMNQALARLKNLVVEDKYRVIAILKSNKGKTFGYRLFHEASSRIMDCSTLETYQHLNSKGAVNVTWDKDKQSLEGTECSMNRIPTVYESGKIKNESVIILSKLVKGNKVSYRVIDYSGQVQTISESELLKFANSVGLSNAKAVNKDGKQFISAIKGELKVG